MRSFVYSTIIVLGCLSSCAPTRDARPDLYDVEANAPNQFNPSSVSPRAEARYGINFGGYDTYENAADEALQEPTDVVETEGLYSFEDTLNKKYVFEEKEIKEPGVSCEVYSVYPNPEKVEALRMEADDLEPVYSPRKYIIIKEESENREEEVLNKETEARVELE